jgi:hypothetical protein
MSSSRVKPLERDDDMLISVLTVQYAPGPAARCRNGNASGYATAQGRYLPREE